MWRKPAVDATPMRAFHSSFGSETALTAMCWLGADWHQIPTLRKLVKTPVAGKTW